MQTYYIVEIHPSEFENINGFTNNFHMYVLTNSFKLEQTGYAVGWYSEEYIVDVDIIAYRVLLRGEDIFPPCVETKEHDDKLQITTVYRTKRFEAENDDEAVKYFSNMNLGG